VHVKKYYLVGLWLLIVVGITGCATTKNPPNFKSVHYSFPNGEYDFVKAKKKNITKVGYIMKNKFYTYRHFSELPFGKRLYRAFLASLTAAISEIPFALAGKPAWLYRSTIKTKDTDYINENDRVLKDSFKLACINRIETVNADNVIEYSKFPKSKDSLPDLLFVFKNKIITEYPVAFGWNSYLRIPVYFINVSVYDSENREVYDFDCKYISEHWPVDFYSGREVKDSFVHKFASIEYSAEKTFDYVISKFLESPENN